MYLCISVEHQRETRSYRCVNRSYHLLISSSRKRKRKTESVLLSFYLDQYFLRSIKRLQIRVGVGVLQIFAWYHSAQTKPIEATRNQNCYAVIGKHSRYYISGIISILPSVQWINAVTVTPLYRNNGRLK